MSDDELAALSAGALIGLLRRLEAELATAHARIAALEAEMARRDGPPKTPQNSSTPPSKGWKRERPAAEAPSGGPRSATWEPVGGGRTRTGSCCASRPTVRAVERT